MIFLYVLYCPLWNVVLLIPPELLLSVPLKLYSSNKDAFAGPQKFRTSSQNNHCHQTERLSFFPPFYWWVVCSSSIYCLYLFKTILRFWGVSLLLTIVMRWVLSLLFRFSAFAICNLTHQFKAATSMVSTYFIFGQISSSGIAPPCHVSLLFLNVQLIKQVIYKIRNTIYVGYGFLSWNVLTVK